MSPSYRKIDYSLRPAKHAERRMLCTIFGRLGPFCRVEDYKYVGFGSLWFSDFILFHKQLGIRDMTSIERFGKANARFVKNQPFRSVAMDFREASAVLPSLDWTRQHFLWLDYDDPLAEGMLLDVATVASHAATGTVLTVSVQCVQAAEVDAASKDPGGPGAFDRFLDQFGNERVPGGTSLGDLYGWKFGSLSRRMVSMEIEAALARRSLSSGIKFTFHEICSIEYKDDAMMTTICGIFVLEDDLEKVQSCAFDKLDFLPDGQKKLRIEMPKLTIREIRHIEQKLPLDAGEVLEIEDIPEKEIQNFVKIYRYFPNFSVLES